MEFSRLVTAFEGLEATSSRTEMVSLLAGLFEESSTEEIGIICYFTVGEIAPAYANIFLGMGESLVQDAIAL
ncbi:MAG TPA: hypothetical protein VE134_02375, partial [Methanomicrobiales archaeon]|nr:hypothetical protein [Methanomicrobiales archaeon]